MVWVTDQMTHPLQNTSKIQRLYEDGLTMQQIADRFGVTRQAVHFRLARAGVKGRRAARPPLKLLRRLYSVEGLTRAAIAEKLGVSLAMVAAEIKRNKIARVRACDRPTHRIERNLLHKLYAQEGLTQIETAVRLGIQVKIVRDELRRHRLTFRHRSGPKPASHQFTYNELHKLYHIEGLGCTEIGRRFGMSRGVVMYQLVRLGIERRPRRRKR